MTPREIFRFENLEYDITGLKELIRENPESHGPFPLAVSDDLKTHISGYDDIDETRVSTIDSDRLLEPPIAVRLEDGRSYRIVDGYHRITRIIREGYPGFMMYLVSYEDSRPFIIEK